MSDKMNFNFSTLEKDIIMLIAKGFKNSEIAEELNHSLISVKYHISKIFKTTGAKNRTNLICILCNKDYFTFSEKELSQILMPH